MPCFANKSIHASHNLWDSSFKVKTLPTSILLNFLWKQVRNLDKLGPILTPQRTTKSLIFIKYNGFYCCSVPGNFMKMHNTSGFYSAYLDIMFNPYHAEFLKRNNPPSIYGTFHNHF